MCKCYTKYEACFVFFPKYEAFPGEIRQSLLFYEIKKGRSFRLISMTHRVQRRSSRDVITMAIASLQPALVPITKHELHAEATAGRRRRSSIGDFGPVQVPASIHARNPLPGITEKSIGSSPEGLRIWRTTQPRVSKQGSFTK